MSTPTIDEKRQETTCCGAEFFDAFDSWDKLRFYCCACQGEVKREETA